MGRYRKIAITVLVLIVCLSGLFAWNVQHVGFDYNFERFFPDDDVETHFFNEHRTRFESDNDFIFISLERDEGVFNQEFLQKVSDFVDIISEDTLVRQVQSLTHMQDYVKAPFGPNVIGRDYLHIDEPGLYQKDSALIFKRLELIQFFITKEADALLVWIKHEQRISQQKCDIVVAHIKEKLAEVGLTDYRMGGRAVGMGYYVHQMQYETVFFIALSFGLVIIFLIFTFRSVWGILVPLSVVTLSMLWIVGFMGTVGQPINLVLTVLPSIIFVVAMSDVIHLVSKYFDELRTGASKIDAIIKAYKEVGFATLLTSITTAMGFLTLLTINMEPIWKFGIYVAIGVMLAFILAYTFLPAMLILTKPPKVAFKKNDTNYWHKFLHGTFVKLVRNRRKVAIGFIGLFAIGTIGLLQVENNYFLLEDLKEDSPLRQDYDYFNEKLVGLRPFEISVKTESAKSVLDYEVLQEIDKVERYLMDEYGLKHSFSIVTALKLANRIEHGGQSKYYVLPPKEDAESYLSRMEKFDRGGQLKLLVDSTEQYARISSQIGDIGRYEVEKRNKKFHTFLENEVNTDLVSFRLTGTAHLLDRNMTMLSTSLTYGLLLAIGLVSLLMGILYRSIRIVLIAMIPNLLPLLMLAAILGFSGVDLSVSTAVIFTVSFGIAVDDTIHFMSKFKLEMNKGRTFLYALKRTYLSTGRAIILTTLILCSGFLLLMLSDFLGTFYIGLYICCTLLFALLADLFLLPVLLLYFYKYKRD